jgi:hypothetical protein
LNNEANTLHEWLKVKRNREDLKATIALIEEAEDLRELAQSLSDRLTEQTNLRSKAQHENRALQAFIRDNVKDKKKLAEIFKGEGDE